jgi:hypothetical protein
MNVSSIERELAEKKQARQKKQHERLETRQERLVKAFSFHHHPSWPRKETSYVEHPSIAE